MTSRLSVVVLVDPELTLTSVLHSAEVREDVAVGTVLVNVTACCSFTSVQVTLVLCVCRGVIDFVLSYEVVSLMNMYTLIIHMHTHV